MITSVILHRPLTSRNGIKITKNGNAVISAIEKYSTHPSIIMIKEKYPHSSKLNFKYILPENTRETIMKLNTSKKCSGNIPTHILKLTVGVITNALTDCINCTIDDGTFPNSINVQI